MKVITRTGRLVDPLDLKPDDFRAEDIAHALAHTCRYNGHTSYFYSVAEHSLNVAFFVTRALMRERAQFMIWPYEGWALVHDAVEAYLGDLVHPLKKRPEFAFFREAEERGHRAIATWLGLDYDTIAPRVEKVDREIVALEAHCLFHIPGEWAADLPPYTVMNPYNDDCRIAGFSPLDAKRAEAEWSAAKSYEIVAGEERVVVFPDAGCC